MIPILIKQVKKTTSLLRSESLELLNDSPFLEERSFKKGINPYLLLALGILLTSVVVFIYLVQEVNSQNTMVGSGIILFWVFFGNYILREKHSYNEVRRHARMQRNALSVLVQSMPYGVVAIDERQNIQLWNRAAKNILKSGPQFIPSQFWTTVLEKPNTIHEANIGDRSFRFSGGPIHNEESSKNGVMLVFEDITDHKNLEKELKYQHQRQANASKMATLGEVAGNLAHEINTPLSTIKISIDGIENALVDNNQNSIRTYMHCIDQAIQRMSNIINAFRRYTRMDGTNESTELIDLREVLNDALEICEPDLHSKGIKLQKNIPKKPMVAQVKPGLMAQAVINLMTNARDAVQGLPDRWVKLSLKEDDGWMRIDVEDAGDGVKGEIKEQIFDPFFTTKERGKGTGIGLGIVRDVARDHGGEVIHDLRDGHTCFEIKFPCFPENKHVC